MSNQLADIFNNMLIKKILFTAQKAQTLNFYRASRFAASYQKELTKFRPDIEKDVMQAMPRTIA